MLRRFVAVAALSLFTTCSSTPPSVCSGTMTSCSGVCTDLKLTDAHCGACGTACASGEACANGACFPTDCMGRPCEPGQVCASGSCVDKECVGVLCPAGQACAKGVCTCAAPRHDCSGACVDLQLDDAHCGTCGRACAQGQRCASGQCFTGACADETCDPLSVCYQGSCVERVCVGVLCPGAEECRGGVCGCTGSVCSGSCADTRLDDRHCGACGAACDGGTSCAAGACLPDDCPGADCDPLSVCYQGTCVEAECVGVLCNGGKVCSGGRCICAPGKTDCDGTCADLQQSAQHCGTCGTACAAGQSCTGGTCVASGCAPGQQRCAGSCVDTSTDPNHCGQCGDACGAGRNCVGGRCTCPQGLQLCGASCVNLSNDSQHCGSCGRSCNGGTCNTDGGCSCPPGRTACNGQCRDLSNDPLFCGSCTNACPATETCGSGMCQCQPGFSRCSGSCLDTRSDPTHCGTCTRVCNNGEACAASACVNPVTTQSNFNPAAVAACPAFPLTLASCNAWSALPQQRFMGSLTNPNLATHVLNPPISIGQRMDFHTVLTTAMTTSAGARQYLRNGAGAAIASDSDAFSSTSQPIFDHTLYGVPTGCSRVVDVQLSSFGGTFSYDVTVTPYTQPGFNRGGDSPDAATPVGLDGGLACDLLCGALTTCSGNDPPQWFAVTVPPQKAIALYVRGRIGTEATSGNLFVSVYDELGRAYGSPVSLFIPSVGADTTARVVNNLLVPQRLLLAVYSPSVSNDLTYTIAIAQEP